LVILGRWQVVSREETAATAADFFAQKNKERGDTAEDHNYNP